MGGLLDEAEISGAAATAQPSSFAGAVALLTDYDLPGQWASDVANTGSDGAVVDCSSGSYEIVEARVGNDVRDFELAFDDCQTNGVTLNGTVRVEWDRVWGFTSSPSTAWIIQLERYDSGTGTTAASGSFRITGGVDLERSRANETSHLMVSNLKTARGEFLGMHNVAIKLLQSGTDYDIVIAQGRLASSAGEEGNLAGYVETTTVVPSYDLQGHRADRLAVDLIDAMAGGCFENGVLRVSAPGANLDILYGAYTQDGGEDVADIVFNSNGLKRGLDLSDGCETIETELQDL